MTHRKPPRVLLADDHRLVAEALRSLLSTEFDVVGVVEDGRSLIEAMQTLRPDVIVADITMPHLNGIDALLEMKRLDKGIRVIFLTMHPEVNYARSAMEAGALGYVLKHSAPAELALAIHAALEGRTYLSPAVAGQVLEAMRHDPDPAGTPAESLPLRQREILQLLCEGRSAKEIGAALGISARTVEFHKYRMMQHLDLHTVAELVHFAIKHNIVPT